MHRIYIGIIALFSLVMTACSEETSSVTSSSESSVIISDTEVEFEIKDSDGALKAGYTIMMFLEQPKVDETLPNIERQVISNASGIAKFDLNDYIVGETTLYFEAFLPIANGYTWESITHSELTLDVGSSVTSTIFVKN